MPYTQTSSKALFAYEELGTGWGKLSFGARFEQIKVTSLGHPTLTRFDTGSRTFTPGSYALGSLWNLGGATPGEKGSGWSATTNLSYTQRAPKDYELYANGPHIATGAYEVGDATLNLERSTNLDLGLAWKTGYNRFGVNAFINQFANYIGQQATGNSRDSDGNLVSQAACANGSSAESGCTAQVLPEYAFRQVKARFSGLEATGNLRLLGAQGLAPAGQSVDLELKGDLVRATNLSTGQALPRIAPVRVGTALVWGQGNAQGWGARLGVDRYAAQNRVPTDDRTTGGYTFFNASATYGMRAGATHLLWFARLDNASNQLAYSASSVLTQTVPGKVPLPGRGLKVGLQASF